ncbi:MAG TPA: hypothetical protein V6D25_20180 [Leptolyngbyaceae cyanobacterium]
MEKAQESISDSTKYYQHFLQQILPSISEAIDETLSDSRANLIENCYLKGTSFSSWRQILLQQAKVDYEILYNELQSDLIASISSAITGNYRIALMSIRSFIELSNLFAYYYYHPLEYSWWLNDAHVIKFSELNQNYFTYYKLLDKYHINTHMYSEWKKVSKYVHAEFKSYMQSSDDLPFLPIYQKSKLGQWITHFSKATIYINQLFYVVFKDIYFGLYSKIEFQNPCQIIRNNINNEALFSEVKEAYYK